MIRSRMVKNVVYKSNSNTPDAFNINPKNVLDSQVLVNIGLFRYYKINAIKYTFYPNSNVAGNTYVPNQSAPPGDTIPTGITPLVTAFETNPDKKYTSVKAVRTLGNAKIHQPLRKFSMYRKLKPTSNIVLGGGITMQSVRMNRNPWISSEDLDFNYGRLYVCALDHEYNGEISHMNQYYTVVIDAYVACKGIE